MQGLVDYEDDDEAASSETTKPPPPGKRKRRRRSDAEGRACTCAPEHIKFLPVQGDWPCLVYVPVPDDAAAREALAAHTTVVEHALRRPLARGGPSSSPHVSLSRPFTARHEQLAGLVASLREGLAGAHATRVSLQGAALFVADDGGRSFGAAVVDAGAPALCAWIAAVDGALGAWGKPAYYSPAVPHASLGHVRGDASAVAERAGLSSHRAQPAQRVVPGYRTLVDSLLMGGGGGGGCGADAGCATCGVKRERVEEEEEEDGQSEVAPPPPPRSLSWLADSVILRAGDKSFAIPLPG
jgi:hypothetical protein